MVVVSSDFAGMYKVEEKASQPFPISRMHSRGSMVTIYVCYKHQICNFSVAKELIAQR